MSYKSVFFNSMTLYKVPTDFLSFSLGSKGGPMKTTNFNACLPSLYPSPPFSLSPSRHFPVSLSFPYFSLFLFYSTSVCIIYIDFYASNQPNNILLRDRVNLFSFSLMTSQPPGLEVKKSLRNIFCTSQITVGLFQKNEPPNP